jgi:enamine deaminase RidA (YjgF/YER057c/UK114 family)
MAQAVIFADTVYLSGQVADLPPNGEMSVADQTKSCLNKVDVLLAEAGSNKSKILRVSLQT